MAQKTITETSCPLNVNPDAPTGPVLKMVNGLPMVASQEMADHFGKRHADLIRSIAAIIRNAPESFNERNFALVEYTDHKGEKRPAYLLTRDGFVIVAMGFTGPKAIKWKIAYIMAFNAMEAELAGQPAQAPALPSADLSKLTTVDDRRPLKALVDAWVAAAKANGKFLAHTEAFRIARTPVGGRKMKELTLADIPVAMAYVQEQLERELAAASPMVAAITATETPVLPPAKKRNDLGDYEALYQELPPGTELWLGLMNKTYEAAERFGREIEAIRNEATRPFRVGRKSMVQTYFDASMSPTYSLFTAARENVQSTYKLTYDALEGCRDAWMLLKKG